jgi:serine/threonine-protein kinase
MGEVYKARDTRLDRFVAIKRLKGEHGAPFQQEARAIAALNHLHICQIYDVGPGYLVMEYVDGRPLRGPLPAEEVTELALQIAGALEEAHTAGILHRDLKPANILLTSKGVAKLLDFGLAKLLRDGEATQTFAISGTPLYMSPEQAEGNVLDARSDVFSFGAVLYELLDGKRAFDNLGAVLRDEPAPLRTTPDLERVIMRCLRKAPADRYQSMHEITAALNECREQPIEEQPSIAVLPFANMSSDSENEYFSDGLSEEIINLLTRIPGLKVIARTSAFAFKGQHQDIRRIAEILGVNKVLEGSVCKAGNRVRITAQLIRAGDGSHVWSERYDRDLTDIFAVQDEIGSAIAGQLKVSQSAQKPRKHVPPVSAYEAFLEGRHHGYRMNPASLAKAFECAQRALAIDPQYASAWEFFGAWHGMMAWAGLADPREMFQKALSAVRKALELDPDLGDAHALLGVCAGVADYDWRQAAMHFRRALELGGPRPRFTFPARTGTCGRSDVWRKLSRNWMRSGRKTLSPYLYGRKPRT